MMWHPLRTAGRLWRHVISDLHYGLEHGQGKDWVAIILSMATATAMVLLVFGGYAIQIAEHVDTSDNVVQLISTLISGITAILGSYVGFRAISGKTPGVEVEGQPEPGADD